MIKIYNGEKIEELTKEGIWIVDFYADWCGPCKILLQNLEALKDNINIIKINVDDYKDIAINFGVMSIPTLILFKEGNNIKETIGYKSLEELEEFIKESI